MKVVTDVSDAAGFCGRCGRCFFLGCFLLATRLDGRRFPFGRGVGVLASAASVASATLFRRVIILVFLRSWVLPITVSIPALRKVAETDRSRLLNRVASFGQSLCLDTRCSVQSWLVNSSNSSVAVPLHSSRVSMNAAIAFATESSSISASFNSVALPASAAANKPGAA